MYRKKENGGTLRLTLLFSLMSFLILLLTMPVSLAGMFLIWHLGLAGDHEPERIPFLLFAFVSLILGTFFAAVFSRRPLKPLQDVIDATDKIARGDYSTRVQPCGTAEFRQLGESFNHMAEKIGSVEMLRNDFVNSFSHEFKTPIVSIRGFAKMLKRDDLTAEERREYLDIIIDESERLADLSENVLHLTKIEKQSIVTDKKRFNASEQIRLVIAMMDSKWHEKQIVFSFDCDEVFLWGNEEMLKQVWINLLDNAIKFSPKGGTVTVRISFIRGNTVVSFADQGPGMTPETAARIFDKFYQGDTSHNVKGNGLGLTIAKRIVQLHGGDIDVHSEAGMGTVLSVSFPQEMR